MADTITKKSTPKPRVNRNLENFKKIVRKAIFLEKGEEKLFNAIPDNTWERIFEANFGGKLAYAQRVLLKQYKEIENIDTVEMDREKKKIHNLDKVTKIINKAIKDKEKIIFITDFDNDGSMAQAIINEYLNVDEKAKEVMELHYAQTVNGNSSRGFTVDLVEKIVLNRGIDKDSSFTVITADNGINSIEEQRKCEEMFPKMKLIVTDHHELEEGMTIEENDRVTIFNPHYNANEFFQKYNISGASTMNTILQNLIDVRLDETEMMLKRQNIRNMNKIAKVSNVLDYVHSHPADKPEKDYVVSRFLELQPLLNINNSITKLITGEVPADALEAILNKIPSLDVDSIKEEAKNIRLQNKNARIWLKIYNDHKDMASENLPVDVNAVFLQELHNLNNFIQDNKDIDENFIGQLRPKIFNLTADDEKLPFFDELNNRMVEVFERVRESEKKIGNELRLGEVITKTRLENSVIAYADKHILSVFNRKFLNKVYNDENPGFSLTLDSVEKSKVSGSFRSLYDISEIFRGKIKKDLEKELGIKIETPGHQRAAGFIVRIDENSKTYKDVKIAREKAIKENTENAKKKTASGSPVALVEVPNLPVITPVTINRINEVINGSIGELKLKQATDPREYILTDMASIGFIDRINATVRGNVAHFERITPLVKLDKDTIWTDSYTTEQYTMEDICKDRKYGYITINSNFHGDTTIVPVEVIRRIVESGYKDYLQLNYMDGGVFMTERVIEEKIVQNVVDLRETDSQEQWIADTFSKHFTDGKCKIDLSREEIKDNPFFKYHDFGELNFELFETMVIRVIDSNKVEKLTVFDVEANGFGNARLMNIGATNYVINPESGKKMGSTEFLESYYVTPRQEAYILTKEQKAELEEISLENLESLTMAQNQQVLFNTDEAGNQRAFLAPETNRVMIRNKMRLPYEQVKNHIFTSDGEVFVNREIKADMLAFLVKEKDFKTSQEITNLTGLSQKLLDQFGVSTAEVDKQLAEYYGNEKGKILFGAHNTPYDAKISRANLPKFYKILRDNHIYDSALFCKDMKLAYDENLTVRFENIPGIPENVIFNHNSNSDFNIIDLIKDAEDGYFPDRTGRYLLEISDKQIYLVDKEEHDKVKVQSNSFKTLMAMKIDTQFKLDDAGESFVPNSISDDFNPIIDPKDKDYVKVLKSLDVDSSVKSRIVYSFKTNSEDKGGQKYFLVASTYDNYDSHDVEEKTKYSLVDMSDKKVKVTSLFAGNTELLNAMIVGELPGTSIKYSVERLSEQWMIRALNLNDETFKINRVDLKKKKYKSLVDKSDALQYFQESYHFDASVNKNIDKFMSYYYNHHNESFFTVDQDGNNESTQIEAFRGFIGEFLKNNKKIQQKFNDSWMYKAVLHVKEPRAGEPITNDLVSLVNYQTNIPEKKIRTIFKEALAFKEKYKIESIIQHELHVNGLFEGDRKGDVLFEDKLTLSLLAQRQYNSYEHNVEAGVTTFNKYQIEARKSFDLAHLLADEIANDSYSFRQGLTYKRTNKTPMVKNIQKRENEALRNDYETVIKFKLNNDVLAQDQAVYAIPIEGIEITRENIEEDKQKLSFIMMSLQINNGLGAVKKKNAEIVKYMDNVLQTNFDKALVYKKELAERYRFIDYNKKDVNIKKSIDLLIDALNQDNKISIRMTENEDGSKDYFLVGTESLDLPKEDIDFKGLGIIQSVVRNYVENHRRVTNSTFPDEENVMNFVDRITRDRQQTNLEIALEDDSITMTNFESLQEDAFLKGVSSKKLNPIKTFFSKTPELRLANEFIESQIQTAADLSPEAIAIWKAVDLKILNDHIQSGNSIKDISNGLHALPFEKSENDEVNSEEAEDAPVTKKKTTKAPKKP